MYKEEKGIQQMPFFFQQLLLRFFGMKKVKTILFLQINEGGDI